MRHTYRAGAFGVGLSCRCGQGRGGAIELTADPGKVGGGVRGGGVLLLHCPSVGGR